MEPEREVYNPPRTRGLLFNLGLIAVLGLLGIALLVLASQTSLGPIFLGYLLGALAIASPIPILSNRSFSLIRSYYEIQRDGIRLKWGYREVDLPITDVDYVELAEDLLFPLEFPPRQWPGAITGTKQQEQLGIVEFLASEKSDLVMIGASDRVFVISPEDPKRFVRTYRTMTELGSLSPIPAYSATPSFLLIDIWRNPILRFLLVLTVILSLALFVLVAWAVPTLSEISLGFDTLGEPLPPVLPGQLFLLPVLNIMMAIASYILSLFYFRLQKDHHMVTVLWSSNALTALFFLIAVLFILRMS
jgi:hypothetical protein